MQLDFGARELTIKLVYCGPALSGKTTNLRALHGLLAERARGRLMALDTRDDRTLFFDLLPIQFTSRAGLTVRLKLFTVPGQVIHDATRRLVLAGADGIAFIVDSQKSEVYASASSFLELRQNLSANGLDAATMPLVIQFNKRDLSDVRPDAELDQLAKLGREPVFKAVATRAEGVWPTFLGLLRATWSSLEQEHGLAAGFGLDGDEVLSQLTGCLVPGASTEPLAGSPESPP